MMRAIVFDFDFTLGDSAEGIIDSANYALEKMGYAPEKAEAIKKTIGLSLAKTLETLTGNSKDGAVFETYFKEKADEVMVERTTIYDGVKEMLEWFHEQGIKLAIVTTKYHYRIEKILEVNHMEHLIDEIVGGDDVTNPKPCPEGMELLKKHLGICEEEMLYVGDSIVDAKTAEAAGVPFVAVLTGTTDAEDFSPYPHMRILDSASKLLAIHNCDNVQNRLYYNE